MRNRPALISRIFFLQSQLFMNFPEVTARIKSIELAAVAPVNISSAEMFGPAARASSASWVRSPNSAINVVVKEFRITEFGDVAW